MHDKKQRRNPTTVRTPARTQQLIDAIRAKTGWTFTTLLTHAVEALARELQVTV